ncbi:hypothetical protein [Oceanivirga miroungae]|uniref:Uncharacterized protein n=1 Tax=Oceanivirga miroungae TaxID=1130046 RepID=A0A6I8M9F2_9FUSO|nr:hypothetical protein [Oceanivirga miroungae]VWL84923.1 hypothetical protein OMES3154_00180 [Oceanivirga miroungae]
MSFYSSMIVCYKGTAFNRIMNVMKKEKLFNENVLLENIEKVIPLDEVLLDHKKEDIFGINFKIASDRILFYIYI